MGPSRGGRSLEWDLSVGDKMITSIDWSAEWDRYKKCSPERETLSCNYSKTSYFLFKNVGVQRKSFVGSVRTSGFPPFVPWKYILPLRGSTPRDHLRYSGTPSDYYLTLADWTVTGRLGHCPYKSGGPASLFRRGLP